MWMMKVKEKNSPKVWEEEIKACWIDIPKTKEEAMDSANFIVETYNRGIHISGGGRQRELISVYDLIVKKRS